MSIHNNSLKSKPQEQQDQATKRKKKQDKSDSNEDQKEIILSMKQELVELKIKVCNLEHSVTAISSQLAASTKVNRVFEKILHNYSWHTNR